MATAAAAAKVYDFLSEENLTKWRGALQPALRKIQKQVHPRLEIEDDAVGYLEELIFRLLAQICSAQPHTMADIESYVQTNFAAPIDTWALNEANDIMEKHAAKRGKGVFVFPVEKIYQQLQKDQVFDHKIELNLIQYLMAILDYVSADILKLAGNFAKNTHKSATYINSPDIKVSMSADPALQVLFQPFQSGQSLAKEIMPHSFNEVESSERSSLNYDDLLRELMDSEHQYIRHLNLILKVFREPFLAKPSLFPKEDIETLFGNLQEVHELSVQLLTGLEESVEMAGGAGEDMGCPWAGYVFEDMAESEEFEAYSTYTLNYMDAVMILEEMLTQPRVVECFKSLEQKKLFKESMQYILPKSLLEPIYHCFYYFDVMTALMRSSPSDADHDALESALTCMLSLKLELERQCARFLPKRKEDTGMFGRRPGYKVSLRKMASLQQKIEAWEGPEIFSVCTEFIMEGSLGIMREGSKRRSERHVFLLDGLTVCCKQKQRGLGEYRFKEKINMRKVKLVDIEDSDDLKFAFMLVEQDQPGFIFFTISKPDKNEWMAALTLLLTRSTFDRLLDAKLREEDKTIPVLRPSPVDYKFVEEDSEENVMYDDPKEGEPQSSRPGLLIKAGTIYKLVERLTFHEYADPTFVRTFLITYRSFCKPSELLNLLIDRFHIPSPVSMDDMEMRRDPLMIKAVKRFKANYVSPIQLRVLNVLRHWVEFHYYDFERDLELLRKLKQFVNSVSSRNMQKWVSSIHRALQKKMDEAKPQSSKPVFSQKPEPIEWHLTRTREDYHILTLHPVEIARQLTLIQSEYFRAIHTSELVDASWMKEAQKETASPHLLRLNRFETSVSNWLASEIVKTENFQERLAMVSRLVDIMVALRELNNFAGMFMINAALESASVFRLRHTFKALILKRQQVLEDMKQIASSNHGFKNYKEKLRTINPPCVPFLGMYMTWIVFIKDGNENKIQGKPDHFINFKKRRKIAGVLQEIQQYQNTPYCLTEEPTIKEYILCQDPYGSMPPNQFEDYLFDLSRAIEPRDQPAKQAPRKFTFDLKPPGSWGTLLFKRGGKGHTPSTSVPPSFQDQGDAHSSLGDSASPGPSSGGSIPPSPTSLTSPQTPFSQNGTVDRGRHYSMPPLPPLPPKPAHSFSSPVNHVSSMDPREPPLPPKPSPLRTSSTPGLQSSFPPHHKPPPLPPPREAREINAYPPPPPPRPNTTNPLPVPPRPNRPPPKDRPKEPPPPPLPPRSPR